LEQQELEILVRSQHTARLINNVYWNLSYLCLTSISTIAAILLIPTQPLIATILGGVATVGTLIWLRSLFNIVIQSRLIS
jgi:hypothetical protein